MTRWETKPLESVAIVSNSGVWGEEPRGDKNDTRVVRTSDIDRNGNLRLGNLPKRNVSKNREHYLVRAGDILIVKSSGSHTNVVTGKSCLVEEGLKSVAFSNFLLRLRPIREIIEPSFLLFYLRSPTILSRVHAMVATTTYPNLRVPEYRVFPVPVPPLPEQRRLATRLGDAFGRFEEMEHERATAEDESGSLLSSVLRELFSQARAKYKENDLGSLTANSQYGTNAKCCETPEGTPILRIPNVTGGRVNFSKLKYAHLPERERRKVLCSPGDLLIVRTNGSPDLVGRCAVFEAEGDWGYASYLIRFRLHLDRVLPEYVSYFLRSPQGRQDMARIRKTSAGQFNVNAENLRGIALPLPPLDKQAALVEIAREVELATDLTRDELCTLKTESTALRQAILRKAFAGNL